MNPTQPPVPNFNLPEPVDAAATEPVAGQPTPVSADLPAAPANPATPTGSNFGDVLSPQQVQSIEQVVRQNMDDPRLLSLKLDDMRAEYIAGRFAKDVKKQTGDKR